jgi:hypothetical protein
MLYNYMQYFDRLPMYSVRSIRDEVYVFCSVSVSCLSARVCLSVCLLVGLLLPLLYLELFPSRAATPTILRTSVV